MTNPTNEMFLPYAGTSGHSGSDTSAARAKHLDTNGKTSDFQFHALQLIEDSQDKGVTWKELSDRLNIHHGSASGVLSVLHLVGKIERLSETRNRCKVYVSIPWVMFRNTEEHKSNQTKLTVTNSVFQVLGKEVLVTQLPNGKIQVAVRDYPSDTWSSKIDPTYSEKSTIERHRN
jgi:hypothetical protein